MILCGMKDVGGANAILPVVNKISDFASFTAIIYSDGASFDRFKSNYPLISASFAPDKVLDWFRPIVVATTACSPGGVVPIALVKAAKTRGIKTVVVQDFWGNHLKHDLWNPNKTQWDSDSLPDFMCVQDEFAKKLVLANWPGYHESNVVVTGQPAYDSLKGVDQYKAKKELREALGLIENWPVVHFPGQIWAMPEAVRATIDALNLWGRPVYFLLRDHPRLFHPQTPEDIRQIYRQYKDIPKELKLGKAVDSSSIRSSDFVNFGADIVMGMYTTAIVQGCYLGNNCLTVWTPSVKDILMMETGNTLGDFPPAALGASLRGTNPVELAVNLERIFLGDTEEMREAQRKHYVSDGEAASRVYNIVCGNMQVKG